MKIVLVEKRDGRCEKFDEKKEEIYQQALAKAGENARTRAESLAKTVGFNLKGAKSITISEPFSPPYYYLGVAELKDSSTPISPNEVNIDVSVTIIFEIN